MRHSLAIVLATVTLFATGCSKDEGSPAAPQPATPPVPNSAVNAVRLFEWGWDHRNLTDYGSVLTDDFRFVFDPGDPAGDHFANRSLDRIEELNAANRIFTSGGGGIPAANLILLDLGNSLVALPDARPGKSPTWHKTVDARFDLQVEADTSMFRAIGGATFFLVRGDSALLPPVPLERIYAGDSTTWYVERLEEHPTISVNRVAEAERTAAPQPAQSTTWGTIKWRYLGSPTGAFPAAPNRGALP